MPSVTFDALIGKIDRIAVVGLGYVGLPLAVHLSKRFSVVGFDRDPDRIRELGSGVDRTLEVEAEELRAAEIKYSADPADLGSCRLIVVAVPTPIDSNKKPDLAPLQGASEIVGRHMVAGSCVVYESTVFPGATEEICVPILEAASGLKWDKDFTVGYSPERINPGDRAHTVDKIVKVVSGSDDATTDLLAEVYGSIIPAGIYRAASIKVAEAAKVIENTQRDLNIALMNELAMIFDRLGIDTLAVLAAAGTKWNFLPFRPGLVGGHCIGVDPYYLTFKAESVGYHPQVILAGRRINDSMGKYIAEQTVKMLIRSGSPVKEARVGVLGLTFKENVPDLRNTRVIDIIRELKEYGVNVLVHDPLADPKEAGRRYDVSFPEITKINGLAAVIVAVPHQHYKTMGLEKIAAMGKGSQPIIVDVKGLFEKSQAESLGIPYWRL